MDHNKKPTKLIFRTLLFLQKFTLDMFTLVQVLPTNNLGHFCIFWQFLILLQLLQSLWAVWFVLGFCLVGVFSPFLLKKKRTVWALDLHRSAHAVAVIEKFFPSPIDSFSQIFLSQLVCNCSDLSLSVLFYTLLNQEQEAAQFYWLAESVIV